jgi:MHS family proline/betaine transporter-like MFS transporter
MRQVPSNQSKSEQTTVPILKKAKVFAITGFGNLLELYDFTLFAVLLPILVERFLPGDDHTSNMLIGYLAFAVSFLIAPIGSIIWGYIGDRFGSGKIFKLSLLLMAFPSLAISLLPTYEEVGGIAPILLIMLRIFQGFSASGEVLASKIYAFDSIGRSGFLQSSAFISAFGGIGVLLAMQAGAYIALSQSLELWRFPFAIGGGLMLIMAFVRVFVGKGDQNNKAAITILSVREVVRNNSKAAIGGFTASAMLGVLSYFMHGFLINFQIKHLGYEVVFAYNSTKMGLIGTVLAASAMGFFYRGATDYRALCRVMLAIAIASVPLHLLLLLKTKLVTYASLFLLGNLLGVFAALSGVYVIASFSKEERCRGALLVNAFGVAIFGGVTPFFMALSAGTHIALPGVVLSVIFIVGYLIIKSLR